VTADNFPSIDKRDCDFYHPLIWLGTLDRLPNDLEIGVIEGGIAETVSEGEEGFDTSCVEMLVSDPDAFFVVDLCSGGLVIQVRGDVELALGESHR